MCQQPASSLYNVKDVAKDAPRKTRFTVGGKLLLAAVVTGSVSALAAHVLAQEEGMLKGAQRLHGRVAPLLVDALHHVQRLGGIRGALLLLLMQVHLPRMSDTQSDACALLAQGNDASLVYFGFRTGGVQDKPDRSSPAHSLLFEQISSRPLHSNINA
eukprot:5254630-Pleurochrysis_carterae.AAC.2